MKKTDDELKQEELVLKLEERKVKALEKIGNSLDALTFWFEEIPKKEWDARIQFYLAKFLQTIQNDLEDKPK